MSIGTTNSYIKIFDVSSEVKTTGALNTYDFMNAINPSPEKGLFYSKYDSISKENAVNTVINSSFFLVLLMLFIASAAIDLQ